MPRRRVVAKRDILPDPKFHNQTVAKFINHVMVSGKKAVAERIVYGAFDRIVERDGGADPKVFENAGSHRAAGRGEVSPRRWCHLSGAGGSSCITSYCTGHALAGRQRT